MTWMAPFLILGQLWTLWSYCICPFPPPSPPLSSNPLPFRYLHENHLTSTLPDSWGGMTSLKELCVYFFSPPSPFPPSSFLIFFYNSSQLQYNMFDDAIPDSWGGMTSLNVLYVYFLPSCLYFPTSPLLPSSPPSPLLLPPCRNMYNNLLDSTLPASLGSLSNLRYLNIGHNAFDGFLPPEWDLSFFHICMAIFYLSPLSFLPPLLPSFSSSFSFSFG